MRGLAVGAYFKKLIKIVKKMDTEKRTNSHQKLPKWSPKHSKIEPKTVQNRGAARDIFRKRGVRTAKNSDKNIDPGKKRGRHHSVLPF